MAAFTESDIVRIKDELVAWISEGKTLREFCRQEGMPHFWTIYDWEKKDADFAQRIAHAREVGEDIIAQEALHIADTPLLGVIRTTKPDGKVEVREEDMLGHRKLQIETRLKLLSKWNPRKWGDSVNLKHTGADGKGPVILSFADLYPTICPKPKASTDGQEDADE